MNLLTINPATSQWLWFAIAGFALLLGISVVAWAIRTAECYEFDEEAELSIDDYEPVTFQEIIDCERPYVSYQ